MANIITPALLSAIFEGFNFSFNNAFKLQKPEWGRVAMQQTSTGAAENYGWMAQIPRIREWIGERHVKGLETFGYQIKNRSFESTFSIKKNQIEDDLYGLFKPIAAQLGQSVALFPDELVFGLLKAGFSSPCYDGQCFFDTDHPVRDASGNEQSVSNVQTGYGHAWFLMDCSQIIKPLIYQTRAPFQFVAKTNPQTSDHVFKADEYLYGVDGRCNAGFGLWQYAYGSTAPLTRENFRAARKAMINLKGDYGRPLGIKPTMLVVGPSLEAVARDLIKAKFLPTNDSPAAPGVLGAAGVGVIDNTDQDIVEVFMSQWLD